MFPEDFRWNRRMRPPREWPSEVTEERRLPTLPNAHDQEFRILSNIPELEKTPFERRMIRASDLAVASLADRIGFRSLLPPLGEGRVHVIDRAVFDSLENDEETMGFFAGGQVFLPRLEADREFFVRILAHEMSHAVSCLETGLAFFGSGDDLRVYPQTKKSGFYGSFDSARGGEAALFRGVERGRHGSVFIRCPS